MMVDVTQEDRVAAIEALNEAERQRSFGGNGTVLSNVCQIIARHRIAAEQRDKLEGARLALEAAAGECVEYEAWHNKHDDGMSGFGHMALGASELRDAIRALDPAKIVGEG